MKRLIAAVCLSLSAACGGTIDQAQPGTGEVQQELLYTPPCPLGYTKIYRWQCEPACVNTYADYQYAYCQNNNDPLDVYSVGRTGRTLGCGICS